MAGDGTRWSHTSGEEEELNKLTTNFEMVESSGKSAKRDREERKKRKEEEKAKEKAEQEAKAKEARKEEQGK
ncbi:hypothetical protein G7Y89_g6441 [Cudoniella acicularis]|uniref:Uncharacterized protein n=1 Tax=Cudoniella acicularis TaxID=354080 RepID=A0A8H4RMP0_9HELO|nr:hypothetical protein G7Y89_g6441 [Cudoniella acicularis]